VLPYPDIEPRESHGRVNDHHRPTLSKRSRWINKVGRTIPDVRISVIAVCESDRVFRGEPPDGRIVIPRPIVIEPSSIIVPPSKSYGISADGTGRGC